MIKHTVSILLLFIIISCDSINNHDAYDIPDVQKHIKEFVTAKKCFEKDIDFVLVSLEFKQDSLVLALYDMYPKVRTMNLNFDTVLYGHRVMFVGEKIKGFSNKSGTEFPKDIIEKSASDEYPNNEEFTTWFYFYKDGKFIYKDTPCSDLK